MYAVYTCIVDRHDLWLVALAVIVCGFGTFTASNLLARARASEGRWQYAWLAVSAVALGSAIWSTHFIAMLAYAPGMPTAYDITLTLLSVVVAIVVTGLGLTVSQIWQQTWARVTTGILVGCGIGTMHFTGMAALAVPGMLTYDAGLFIASWVLGITLSVVACMLASNFQTLKQRMQGAGVLALAIAALHFTAMAAATIVPNPTQTIPDAVVDTRWLAISISIATFTVLLLALASAAFDRHLARRGNEETERLRDLANASTEGIVICRGSKIVDANKSFVSLVKADLAAVVGRDITEYIPADSRNELFDPARPDAAIAPAVETVLRRDDDEPEVPVEIRLRKMHQRGREHDVILVRDLRDQKRAEAHIQHLAHHDPLTDLANRTLFASRLRHDIALAQRGDTPLAVMCIDLDRFKEVNDVYGHPVGDALLVQVADRLKGAVRETDTVARLGGDEFAIVQCSMSQPDSASYLAERLLDEIGGTYNLDAVQLRTSASIGIAMYPHDGTDVDTLLRNADLALYRAKANGRAIHCFFEADMDERLRAQRLLEIDLRDAIDHEELQLVYQPQAEASSGEIVGFEALLRWTHPTKGPIPPADFIPLAEQCGLIGRLGLWVLREACREAASWKNAMGIAVNLSPVQFQHGQLADDVEAILSETGLAPQRLELEITEGVLLKDKTRTLKILRRLKDLGVRVAMDDFGTGYSSLSSLQSFPFDKLKIDRSFVMNLTDESDTQTIIRAIIALGRGLNLPVIAEGVESDQQLELLRSEECDGIQGYLIGKPLPIESYAALTGVTTVRKNAKAA